MPMNMLVATAEVVSSTLRRPFETFKLSILADASEILALNTLLVAASRSLSVIAEADLPATSTAPSVAFWSLVLSAFARE